MLQNYKNSAPDYNGLSDGQPFPGRGKEILPSMFKFKN